MTITKKVVKPSRLAAKKSLAQKNMLKSKIKVNKTKKNSRNMKLRKVAKSKSLTA